MRAKAQMTPTSRGEKIQIDLKELSGNCLIIIPITCRIITSIRSQPVMSEPD